VYEHEQRLKKLLRLILPRMQTLQEDEGTSSEKEERKGERDRVFRTL